MDDIKLITYTSNDIIQRCQNSQSEKLTFIQCMTIGKIFIEHEKQSDFNHKDFQQIIDSLVRKQFIDIHLIFVYYKRLIPVYHMMNSIFNLKLYQHYILLCVIQNKWRLIISNKTFKLS